MTKEDVAAVKSEVASRVYELADKVDWRHLTIDQRQRHYTQWTAQPDIGGELRKLMDPGRVRVYLKDTLMKNYAAERRPTLPQLLSHLSVPCRRSTRSYVKPQAVLCDGTALYTLVVAKEWRLAITSAFERAYPLRRITENVVFVVEHTVGRYVDPSYREMIAAAAAKLEVEVRWVGY